MGPARGRGSGQLGGWPGEGSRAVVQLAPLLIRVGELIGAGPAGGRGHERLGGPPKCVA